MSNINTTKPILLLITHSADTQEAKLALRFAKNVLEYSSGHQLTAGNQTELLDVFFYADGAHIANGLSWQPADQLNMTHEWQQLAKQYDIKLPVCVSTALARGVVDQQNAKRHNLSSVSLADGFMLVGLSELVLKMDTHKIIQF